jgi:hypothetical protein
MSGQDNLIVAQLQAETLALQEAAAAEAIVVAGAAAAATVAAEAAVTAATVAAAGAPPGGAGGPPPGVPPPRAAPPPPAPAFTLAPALANTATYLDLTTSNGAKHFKSATEPLGPQPFDFTDDSDLQVFLNLVLTRAQVCGWNHMFDFATGATRSFNLLSQHGLVPLLAVRTDALTYHATPSKRAQDSFMACQCLLGPLTLDFLKIISADSASCHLPPILAMNGAILAGPLLLKLIIGQAHVDS